MYLDLSGKNDNYNQFVVVHEFGHVLGLGHEHQRSDFRPCLIPYLDKTKMEQTFKELKVPGMLITSNCSYNFLTQLAPHRREMEGLGYGC